MLIIGIDPGRTGGISFIRTGNREIISYKVYDMPTWEEGVDSCELYTTLLREIFEFRYFCGSKQGEVLVYMEKTGAMSKGGKSQGSVSIDTFGENKGIIKGVLGSFGIRPILIAPQTWQGEFWKIPKEPKLSIEERRKLNKANSMTNSKELMPNAEYNGPRGGAKDGRSDAMLIGLYGFRERIGSLSKVRKIPPNKRPANRVVRGNAISKKLSKAKRKVQD